ncbi:hypothetical protein AZA_90613 [Nitrospirillum viridazoti Y2]|nr:hypothetical protein AZA_90613 [Nitrospirillum amazonense Y2]
MSPTVIRASAAMVVRPAIMCTADFISYCFRHSRWTRVHGVDRSTKWLAFFGPSATVGRGGSHDGSPLARRTPEGHRTHRHAVGQAPQSLQPPIAVARGLHGLPSGCLVCGLGAAVNVGPYPPGLGLHTLDRLRNDRHEAVFGVVDAAIGIIVVTDFAEVTVCRRPVVEGLEQGSVGTLGGKRGAGRHDCRHGCAHDQGAAADGVHAATPSHCWIAARNASAKSAA